MHPAPRCLAPALLLLCLACQPQAAPAIYGPWEEGLTLAYENPSEPQPQRAENRLQLRVAHSAINPGGPGLTQLDLTSAQGQMNVFALHHDGGIDLVDAGGRVLSRSLPVHFPDTTRWQDRGTEFSVIGRGAWDGAAILPADSDPVGIWVEARPAQGLRRRILYLPDLGEVEAREERNGAWIVVNRLVARRFTDFPTFKRP